MKMMLGAVPRRTVNLPPNTLGTLLRCAATRSVVDGPAREQFSQQFARYLSVPHILGASSGRDAFQLALQALDLAPGAEIIFPAFTFPVMPMVAKLLGFRPVFCDVDPNTFNAGSEHIAAKLTADTGAVVATHLFGRPCDIEAIAELVRARGIKLLEDCAHACGVRVGGNPVGTFGDIGLFSFAEGKNMPCCGGGAIAVQDPATARRAEEILRLSTPPAVSGTLKTAVSVWLKWLLTHPVIFGMTAYPVLRFKQLLGKPLMDSQVGDDLLARFSAQNSPIVPLANLQAAVGLHQLKRIDAFNRGARENALLLTRELGSLPGLGVPQAAGEDHIYVYYPLSLPPGKRDALREHLLSRRIDSKVTDMSDCGRLKPFRPSASDALDQGERLEASLLEICVYPRIPQPEMIRIAREVKAWVAKDSTAG